MREQMAAALPQDFSHSFTTQPKVKSPEISEQGSVQM